MRDPSELVEWLMAAKTPTIRYLTARDLLGLAEEDEQLYAARAAIMQEGAVPAILAKQTEAGHWTGERNYYSPKYVSTHWSLLLLTELRVDPNDERFQRGVDFMLTDTVERLQHNQGGLACFWGNVLEYAVYAHRVDDPRTQAIARYLLGDLTNGQCRCYINNGTSCAWGVVRTLWGLAALPDLRTQIDAQAAINQAVHFLLDSFSLIDANYPTPDNGKIHPMWFKLNFPLFYQVDILFTLRVLKQLGALHHPNARAALNWLEAQQQPNGRWHGSSPFRQRTWREMGSPSETSRWVSLQAATLLRNSG